MLLDILAKTKCNSVFSINFLNYLECNEFFLKYIAGYVEKWSITAPQ